MKKSKITKITTLGTGLAVVTPVVATACTSPSVKPNDNNQTINNNQPKTSYPTIKRKCGSVNTTFECYPNNTASIIQCDNNNGTLMVPATVIDDNNVEYRVVRIAALPACDDVDGINFYNATNLIRI